LRGATPVGYLRPILNPLTEETAESVTISDLLESPEDYEGKILQVSGTYYQRQVVVCSSRSQLSPARWALSDSVQRIPAGGMADQLQSLPSGRIDIGVIGRWLRWQGPVGCGRQAQVTEVWYLDVLEVISPNPITIAAVGPQSGSETLEISPPIQPPDSTGGYPGPDEIGEPSITLTPIISDTTPTELPATPVLLPSPSVTTAAEINPTPSTAVTAAPTSTSSAATPTVTTTPNATPDSDSDEVTVDQIDLAHGSIETGELGLNEIHRWPFVITTTAVITINVASEIPLDADITIEDPSGNVIAKQNNAQDGAPEVLTDVSLTEPGTYNILISSENDTPGYYAILVLDALNKDYYTFVFNGTMEIGQSESTNILPNNDQFWQFIGTAGVQVTIRLTPNDSSDLFLRLYDVTGSLIEGLELHNETEAGEVEEILSYTLPDTGFYSILVGEWLFGSASYSISISNG
jgi:hypothetical protein